MNQNIINYLTQNKNTYSEEVLIGELKKAGYSELDIIESANYIYSGSANSGQAVSRISNFWDFKTAVVYQNNSEKLKDFFFGFLAPYAGILVAWIPLAGLALFAFEFFSIIYLFSRRKFIALGMIGNLIFGMFLMLVFVMIIFLFGGMRSF
jgi:hypothetical protein